MPSVYLDNASTSFPKSACVPEAVYRYMTACGSNVSRGGYQGTRSPNTAEREEKGWSEAWMHHKGRNRHHWEYWTDLDMQTKVYAAVPMPPKYLAEMVADRIAACKTYQGSAYTDASALGYLERSNEARLMHPDTVRALRFLLTKLRDEGERAAFCYIKTCLRKNVPFCGQETQSGTIVGI